mmetsp:Transcript_29640/g.55445  ORF Transcript_29640/g.55445 Transcript_29640/m.55445 type:complete len:121 (-) Transcript_29640:189-551(-)
MGTCQRPIIGNQSLSIDLAGQTQAHAKIKHEDPTVKHQDLPQEVKSTYVRLRTVVELSFQPVSDNLPRPIELARDKAVEKFKIHNGMRNPLSVSTDSFLRSFPGLDAITMDVDHNSRCDH